MVEVGPPCVLHRHVGHREEGGREMVRWASEKERGKSGATRKEYDGLSFGFGGLLLVM